MSNKIDVLLLTDNSIYIVGGAEKSTSIIAEGLKNTYSIGIVQPGVLYDDNNINGVNYYYLTSSTRLKNLIKRPAKFLKYIINIKKVINVDAPNIIHTQGQVSFFIIALLKKMKLISKDIIIMHTERGLFLKYNYLIKKIFFFFIKELDVFITTTNFNMNSWEKHIKKRNLSVACKVIENTAGQQFEKYNLSYETNDFSNITIGFAGRYTEWKNWNLAIEISKRMHDLLGNRLKVKMAIGCLDETSRYETEIMFNELKDIFGENFKGEINIDTNSMDLFYYDLDVFILTSKHNTESFGRTLVEAMSRKTAVLTTDSGGSVEVVGNKMNVCETPEDFVNRIMTFNNNNELLNREKEMNMERVNKIYSTKNNIYKHEMLYSTNMSVK